MRPSAVLGLNEIPSLEILVRKCMRLRLWKGTPYTISIRVFRPEITRTARDCATNPENQRPPTQTWSLAPS